MNRRLRLYVHGVAAEDGSMHSFGPDDEVPEWAVAQVADHNWVDGGAGAGDAPAPPSPPADERPPHAGAGSSTEAWAAYARAHGYDVAEDATRADIIAAVEADDV